MPIFKLGTKTILFLHIPKAGGTSVERWLSQSATESFHLSRNALGLPCVPQHFHGALIDALFAPGFFDYSFAVTRNPYRRLLSEYNYRMGHRRRRDRLLPAPSFGRWTRRVLRRQPKTPYLLSNHIRPQIEFCIDGTETFRLEDQLPELYARLAGAGLGDLAEDLPQSNRSVPRATQIDPATAALIYDFYRSDFDRFGYARDSYR